MDVYLYIGNTAAVEGLAMLCHYFKCLSVSICIAVFARPDQHWSPGPNTLNATNDEMETKRGTNVEGARQIGVPKHIDIVLKIPSSRRRASRYNGVPNDGFRH